jgi:hypothetical protein
MFHSHVEELEPAAKSPLRSKYVGDWQSDLKHGQAVEDPQAQGHPAGLAK